MHKRITYKLCTYSAYSTYNKRALTAHAHKCSIALTHHRSDYNSSSSSSSSKKISIYVATHPQQVRTYQQRQQGLLLHRHHLLYLPEPSLSRRAIAPVRFDEGTRTTQRNAATGERGCPTIAITSPTCRTCQKPPLSFLWGWSRVPHS